MNSPKLAIRPYQPGDEGAVIRLWHACGLTRPWNDPHKDIARKLSVQSELFLVGEADGVVVASVMAGYDGHRGWVNYLAVDPACQRRGYARALMRHVEQAFVDMGCPKINLMIRTGNSAVLDFYKRLGYQPDDVISCGKRLIPDLPAPVHP
jgi:ribosomal protein S18 acetylase RimI-like enzyme